MRRIRVGRTLQVLAALVLVASAFLLLRARRAVPAAAASQFSPDPEKHIEVYQERRSCEICMRVQHELRTHLPANEGAAPVAIGGTLSGDHYALPTGLIELVLKENHWNATSLGTNLPVETLLAAIEHHQPQLVWVSWTISITGQRKQ